MGNGKAISSSIAANVRNRGEKITPANQDLTLSPSRQWVRKDFLCLVAFGLLYFVAVRLAYLFPDSANVMAACLYASNIDHLCSLNIDQG